jgi:predicted transcriptional regulator
MKVKDIMMRTAARCHPDTNLGAAVEMMWTRNCGILPVVDAEDKLVGVITDRDICIALGT